MTLDQFLRLGETIDLGTYVFDAAEIKAFASKYDPQPFHLDEAAAARSVFGKLCASGWHTAATWMKVNLRTRDSDGPERWAGPGPVPVFGPSPGFTNLRWMKPVYVGETIRFTRTNLSHRALATRPGWRLLTMKSEAYDSSGDKVIEFDSAVLLKVDDADG